MDKNQVDSALNRLFHEQGKRIVLWNDAEQEFVEAVSSIDVPGVTVMRLDQQGSFTVKMRIECQDRTGKYLIYAPFAEPDYDSDWLLDVRLYSHTFRADRASIILDELALANQSLRPHVDRRKKFFDHKDRFKKLQALVTPEDTEADLDRKMLAVLVKADQPELFHIVRTLFHSLCEGDIDLDSQPPAWELITKFGLDEAFWQMVKVAFGYTESAPTLKNLLIRLLITDFAHNLKNTAVPGSWYHLLLPLSGRSNAVACMSHWRDSSSKGTSYDRFSEAVADLLKVESQLDGFNIEHLLDIMTFLPVEKCIARNLRDRVRHNAETLSADEIRQIAVRRQDGHWASLNVIGSASVPRKALHAVYDALISAADFFSLRNAHRQFEFSDAAAMYRSYEKELFRFDQLYRHFCEAADLAEAEGWGVLKPLREEIEACYGNWFILSSALAWGRFIEPADGKSLLNEWAINGVAGQQQFFKRRVAPRLGETESRRVFVIISDAFRYEAAEELTRELNGKYRFQAELSSQLGVLPSYTALGMASLLPHRKVAYKATGEVLVDDRPTASFDQR
ncbi:MAG: BREX-1 system phosphatase PglZ type A, partial [Limisphaerales bacterium]